MLYLVLSASVGLVLMFGVQLLAEPVAAHFLAAAHVRVPSPALPTGSVLTLSRYTGLAGFIFCLGQAIRPAPRSLRRARP
jgi:hypothetical protein